MIRKNQTSALPDRIRTFTERSNGFEDQYVPKMARELLYEAADRIEELESEKECRDYDDAYGENG